MQFSNLNATCTSVSSTACGCDICFCDANNVCGSMCTYFSEANPPCGAAFTHSSDFFDGACGGTGNGGPVTQACQ